MLALFWRTIKDRKYTILIYCLASILFLWMYIAFYPTIHDKAQEFSQLLSAYPESFMKAFNINPSQLLFTTLESFLAMEQFNIVWPIMLFAFFIAWGGSAIAGEIEKGTIEILLAQPISRLKIFLAKYLSGTLMILLFTAVSVFAVIPLAKIYHIDYQLFHYWTIALIGFLLGGAVFSIAIFFSALFSDKGKAYFLTSGILVVMYVLNIMASLRDNLETLKYFSFFYYYDPAKALIDNQIDHWAYLVFISTIVLFTIFAALIFQKRDISV